MRSARVGKHVQVEPPKRITPWTFEPTHLDGAEMPGGAWRQRCALPLSWLRGH